MTTTPEARLTAIARVLNKLHAEACNVNEADSWAIQGEDFRKDARAVLAAIDALPAPSGEPAAEQAPPHNLPSWDECALRVQNSDFIAKRVAEGGYGAEPDSKLANNLHRFIYEYDDSDPYRSAWFMHRLELALKADRATTAPAPQAAPAPLPSDPMAWPLPCDVVIGHMTHKKGTSLQSLVNRARTLADMVREHAAEKLAPQAAPAPQAGPTPDMIRAGWALLPSAAGQPWDWGASKARAVYLAMQAAQAAPAPQAEPTDEEIGHVTIEQARAALDSMDDFARMKTGVDAMGPRRTLQVFIAQAEAAQAAPAPQAKPVAFDAEGFREWVARELPDDTIIGRSAWWADHLTAWAQRFARRGTTAQAAPAPLPRQPLTDAQIEKLREETFSTNNPFCPCDSKTMRKAVRSAERAHGITATPAKEPAAPKREPWTANEKGVIAGNGQPCPNNHDPDCLWPDCNCFRQFTAPAKGEGE